MCNINKSVSAIGPNTNVTHMQFTNENSMQIKHVRAVKIIQIKCTKIIYTKWKQLNSNLLTVVYKME